MPCFEDCVRTCAREKWLQMQISRPCRLVFVSPQK